MRKTFATVSLFALALSGCGGNSNPAEEVTTPAAPASSAESSSSVTTGTSEPSQTAVETESATPAVASTPDSSKPSASDTSANLSTDSAKSTLTLDDFAAHSDGWDDGTFDIAEKSEVTGMSTKLTTCVDSPKSNGLEKYDSSVQTLRLNLGHKYENLKFDTGQNNNSEALDRVVSVRVTDGTQQIGNIYNVAFDEIKNINIDVKDRNIIFIQFYMTESSGESCSSQGVSPVVFNVNLD